MRAAIQKDGSLIWSRTFIKAFDIFTDSFHCLWCKEKEKIVHPNYPESSTNVWKACWAPKSCFSLQRRISAKRMAFRFKVITWKDLPAAICRAEMLVLQSLPFHWLDDDANHGNEKLQSRKDFLFMMMNDKTKIYSVFDKYQSSEPLGMKVASMLYWHQLKKTFFFSH